MWAAMLTLEALVALRLLMAMRRMSALSEGWRYLANICRMKGEEGRFVTWSVTQSISAVQRERDAEPGCAGEETDGGFRALWGTGAGWGPLGAFALPLLRNSTRP